MTDAARTSRRADEIRQRRVRTTTKLSSVSRNAATLGSRVLPDRSRVLGDRRRSDPTTVGHPPRLKTKKRLVKSAETVPPPVMVRSHTAWGLAPDRKRSKKARRRFDVALPMQGAEMRLPALPQLAIGWRVVSFGLVLLLAAAVYFFWNSPKFQVNDAKVDGLQRVSSRDVETVLGAVGQPVFSLDAGQLRQKLAETFPEFSAVAVQISIPNSLVVKVTERKPVLTWQQDGKTNLVDANGVAFPLRTGAKPGPGPVVEAKGAPPSVPLPVSVSPSEIAAITGRAAISETVKTASRQLMSPEMVTAILTLAPSAPQGTVLVYDAQHGLGWKDKRGWDIYFGDAQDIDNKLQVYKALVKYLQSKEIQPVLISVEHVYAPYYRAEEVR
jgi:hypothetical protein